MLTARVEPMPEAELAEWRKARADAGAELPEATEGDSHEALTVVVGEVAVGGAILTYDQQGGRPRASLRLLQTTLPDDATEEWAAVLAAFEAHLAARGALTFVTAVPPTLAGVFQAGGFKATMTTHSKRIDPATDPELQEDRRVAVRPMEPAERRRFAEEVMTFLRSGMERSGVLAGIDASLDELSERVTRLGDDSPPQGDLLMMGVVEGEPIGRAWATLVHQADGAVDFLGNTIDLFPEFRGQGLTRSFLGALVRHVREIGVRDIRLRVYAYDTRPRRTFVDNGAWIGDVHLRKDLA